MIKENFLLMSVILSDLSKALKILTYRRCFLEGRVEGGSYFTQDFVNI